MAYITIKSTQHSTLLFEGDFETPRHCLEAAVSDHTDLRYADLRHLNLSNCNIDDAILEGADFTGSNLSGANISEANLSGAIFKNTNLIDTCLCYSNLSESHFENTRFGATDIAGANLDSTTYSSPSCFSLNFTEAQSMQFSSYLHMGNLLCTMNTPPRILKGILNRPLILLDQHILIGAQAYSTENFNIQLFLDLMVSMNMQKNRLT